MRVILSNGTIKLLKSMPYPRGSQIFFDWRPPNLFFKISITSRNLRPSKCKTTTRKSFNLSWFDQINLKNSQCQSLETLIRVATPSLRTATVPEELECDVDSAQTRLHTHYSTPVEKFQKMRQRLEERELLFKRTQQKNNVQSFTISSVNFIRLCKKQLYYL